MRAQAGRPRPVTDLMQHVYEVSQLRGRWFRDPADTWTMALFHRDAFGSEHVTGLPLPTEEAKSELARVVQFSLRATRSVEALLVVPAWEAYVPPEIAATADVWGGAAAGYRRDDVDSPGGGMEVLLFLHVGAAFALTRSAPVLRGSGRLPTLGPLSPIHGEGIEVTGLFTDAMRKGIG
jgi:hypothetical protein